MIEQVRQVKPDELAQMYETRISSWQDRRYPFYYLPRLLRRMDAQGDPESRAVTPVVFVRSGSHARRACTSTRCSATRKSW